MTRKAKGKKRKTAAQIKEARLRNLKKAWAVLRKKRKKGKTSKRRRKG